MEYTSRGAATALTRSLRVARNVSTTLITQAVTWILSLVVIFFLPRYLGPGGLGEITVAGSFAGIFGLISSVGASTVLMRDIPRDVSRAGALITASMAVRIPLAIFGTFLGLIVGKLFGYSHFVLVLTAICLLGNISGIVGDTLSSALRGLETFSVANAASIIDKVITSSTTIVVCVVHGPLWLIVGSMIISSFFSSGYMFWRLCQTNIVWTMPSKAEIIALVRAGMPFLSGSIFVTIYAKSDAIFLSKLSSISAVGWYNLAFRVSGAAMSLPAIVCSAMLPPLSSLFKESLAAFVDGASRLMNLMIICAVPFGAAMILCPVQLVDLLSHHVSSFRPAVPVVQVYGVATVLWFVSQAAATSIIACDQEKIFARAMSVAALFSIPLTALCVYAGQHWLHNGAVGAAVSDLIAEIYLLGCYIKVLPKGVVSFTSITTCCKALVAAVPMLVEFYVVPAKYVLFGAVPCVAIYAILCLQFHCVHAKDIELMRQMIRGRLRGAST
jgi:O-antigen/teichoic acid export membrane protein